MKKLIVFLLLFVHGIQAHATTLIYKDLTDLVGESDQIVMGTVHSIEYQYDLENEISTFVTLDQLNVIYGIYDQVTLNIQFKGGKIGTEILHIDGVPRFQLGDRVLLFLRAANKNAMVPIVGWTQGVFRVTFDEASGEEIITDHDGNPILSIEGSTLVKEYRHSSAAAIVDLATGTTPSDTNLFGNGEGVSPGIPDDASPAAPFQIQPQTTVPKRSPMSIDAFLDAVEVKLNQKSMKPGELQGKP